MSKNINKLRLWWRYGRKRIHSMHSCSLRNRIFCKDDTRAYLLAIFQLGLGILFLVIVIYKLLLPDLAVFNSLRQQQVQASATLKKVEEFALTHADYDAYSSNKYRQLQQLRTQLPAFTDGNQLQGRLQQLAVRQGLLLRQLQLVEPKQEPQGNKIRTNKKLALKQLKVELAGDYYALVRWLKQAEKQQLQVQNIEIKGLSNGNVLANINLRCVFMSQDIHNLE